MLVFLIQTKITAQSDQRGIVGPLEDTMYQDDDGSNKRRRIRIDDDDEDEIGSNPDELINDQYEAESDEEGEDLLETWKECVA